MKSQIAPQFQGFAHHFLLFCPLWTSHMSVLLMAFQMACCCWPLCFAFSRHDFPKKPVSVALRGAGRVQLHCMPAIKLPKACGVRERENKIEAAWKGLLHHHILAPKYCTWAYFFIPFVACVKSKLTQHPVPDFHFLQSSSLPNLFLFEACMWFPFTQPEWSLSLHPPHPQTLSSGLQSTIISPTAP